MTASSNELELRKFHAEHELPHQRDLFRDCFPETIGTAAESGEHYRWKFHSLPGAVPSYEFCAWDSTSQTLLGYYAALPYQYVMDGESYRCGMVCDVMTHSKARGKGIFTKLGRFSLDQLQHSGIDFVSGYPIRPEVIPGHLKVGWKVVEQLPLYIKPIAAGTLTQHGPLRLIRPFASVALSAWSAITRPRAPLRASEHIRTESSTSFFVPQRTDYDAFFARWTTQRRSYLQKDSAFMRWRLGAPDTKYFVSTITSGTDITAVAISRRVELRGIPTLAILDYMELAAAEDRGNGPTSAGHGALINELVRLAKEAQADVLAIMTDPSSAQRLRLRRWGFIRSPFTFKLILRALSERALARADAMKLSDIMWIDSDDL
jgi:GNAT superfamily N-acetyltransferase